MATARISVPDAPAAKPPTEAQKMDVLRNMVKGPYTRLPNGCINCTFIHPTHGEIPFTADPNDPEEHGRLLHKIVSQL
jgi:hypothetical protein